MSWKKYWDLGVIIILSLFLDVLLFDEVNNAMRTLLGLAFVIFFPGYVLMITMFPEKKTLNNLDRIILSFGISIAIIPFIGIGLNYTPWGIRPIPAFSTLTIYNITLAIVAIHRRSTALDPWIPPVIVMEKKKFKTFSTKLDMFLTLLLICVMIMSIGTMAYVVTHSKPHEAFTEFYILGPNGTAENYPANLTIGEKASVIIGIANHENRNMTYYIQMWLVSASWDNKTDNIVIHEIYPMQCLDGSM